ncbi:reverse transcriptase domain-containing protein, partial [Clostridioides difficile]|uniref:reverse transcriptase domain-containing protein n=1 Tax=Clostridioides difficile TaxID=1496 RepID=UPI0021155639
VPHERLIRKLKAYGIDGNVVAWIEDWLKNRTQRVVLNGEASELVEVASGVPQGSVLGPLLFLIYVNDIDTGLNSAIAKFADDTKLGGSAVSEEECSTLQRDLNNIFIWSKTWGMNFNVEKCKVIHIGHNNINFPYTIDNRPLKVVSEEKDLGVIVSSDLKFHKQCVEQCKKANRILGFIFRHFEYKSKDIILQLYKSLVRPHLEYAVQFWSPYLLKDIDMLERVQRRATKMIPGMRSLPYEERLKHLKLPSLAFRRLRGELIETFKILKGFDDVRKENLFNLNENNVTRNNGLKLVGKRFNTNISKNYYTNKVINSWNSLPAEVVAADSINSFKNRLDKHLKARGFL